LLPSFGAIVKSTRPTMTHRGRMGVFTPSPTSEHAMNDNLHPNGRTPEEDRRYRVKSRLRLREEPLTKEERQDAIDMIFERDSELLQLLADA